MSSDDDYLSLVWWFYGDVVNLNRFYYLTFMFHKIVCYLHCLPYVIYMQVVFHIQSRQILFNLSGLNLLQTQRA